MLPSRLRWECALEGRERHASLRDAVQKQAAEEGQELEDQAPEDEEDQASIGPAATQTYSALDVEAALARCTLALTPVEVEELLLSLCLSNVVAS